MLRKKILYVARPQTGGMSWHIRTLVNHFSQVSGCWDISLAIPNELPANIRRETIKYFRLPLRGHASPFHDFGVFTRLLRICWGEKVDLVHIHGYKAALVALPAAKIWGCPVLVTVHNSLAYPRVSLLPDKYYHYALKGLDLLTTSYITVSHALRNELLARGVQDSKVVTIYNGIDTAKFKPKRKGLVTGKTKDNALGVLLACRGLRVGTAGRLVVQKGMDIFIKAAARVSTRFPGVYFFIAGEGPERGKLENLRDSLKMRGKIFLLGNVDDIAAFFSLLDIFVLASRSEGLSVSLLEAGAAGLPRVAAATGGIPEVIKNGKTGLLFPSGDSAALEQVLCRLLLSPQEREMLGLSAEGDVRRRFSKKRMLEETEKIYSEILVNNIPRAGVCR
ncbi:MAG: glycosyltransferase family 4 protein [Dethiobacteria bacterium]|jgi:glycosyltransferase involved in cell wall biosynthesis